jgi:ADP-ribose pyrophosphatase
MSSADPKTILHEGRFLRLVKHGHWEYAERSSAQGAVVIVAITDDRRLLFTEQHRIPMGKAVIELPAGLVGDIPGEEDEAWAEAARRELLEETGYAARAIRFLAHGPVSAGFGTETVSVFLAKGIRRVHRGGGVDGEDIRVHEVPLDRADGWLRKQVRNGLLVDPKVFAGLYFAERATRRPGSHGRRRAERAAGIGRAVASLRSTTATRSSRRPRSNIRSQRGRR